MCVFLSFLLKSQISTVLVPKTSLDVFAGMGRRERRCAGEEKEEGLSCLSSKIAGEHSVKDLPRRSEGGGGSKASSSAADPLVVVL